MGHAGARPVPQPVTARTMTVVRIHATTSLPCSRLPIMRRVASPHEHFHFKATYTPVINQSQDAEGARLERTLGSESRQRGRIALPQN